MPRLKKLLFSLIIILASTGKMVFAQGMPAVSANGHIVAEIIPVFTASETSQLNFGKFAPGPQGGIITVTPESTVSVLGNVYRGTGIQNAASFYVSGELDAAFSITLPSEPVILMHTQNAKTLVVADWKSIPEPGIGAGMLQNGFQIVNVGATLKVGSLLDNPVGIYTGTYTITFDFN